jgi:hypothetical protein
MKLRVYKYYVGCLVYDVEAADGQSAMEEVRRGNGMFLHEAHDPNENDFFAEVFTCDEYGDRDEDAVFVEYPEAAKIWRTCPWLT